MRARGWGGDWGNDDTQCKSDGAGEAAFGVVETGNKKEGRGPAPGPSYTAGSTSPGARVEPFHQKRAGRRNRKDDILSLSQSNQVFLHRGVTHYPTFLTEVHFYTFGLLGQYPKNKTSPETGVTQHRIPVSGRIYW